MRMVRACVNRFGNARVEVAAEGRFGDAVDRLGSHFGGEAWEDDGAGEKVVGGDGRGGEVGK